MDLTDDKERDAHNKKIARDSSWLCALFQQNPVSVGIKKKILSELLQEHQTKLTENKKNDR